MSSAPAPPARVLIVLNPVSGRGQGKKAAEELAAALDRRGVAVEVFPTGAKGDAFTRLRCLEPGFDRVVSVGGDGTLREVLEGLVDTELPVGILPFGTGNVLAHELGLPRDVHHFLELLLQGKTQGLDVMRVNGHLSFLVTGVGVDAMAVAEVERRRRGPIRKSIYYAATLRVLSRYQAPRLAVEVDGKAVGTHGFVLVSNAANYGGILHLDPGARLDDRQFEIYLFPTGTRRELLRGALRGFFRHLPGGPVRRLSGSSVRITSEDPVPYQIDGDLGGTTPIELDLAPHPYRLLVP